MSRKNHQMIGGQLRRIDKKFCHLKQSQVTKIANWLRTEYAEVVQEHYRKPTREQSQEIVSKVYTKIEQAGIWIPFGEVLRYYHSKQAKFYNHLLKQREPRTSQEPQAESAEACEK